MNFFKAIKLSFDTNPHLRQRVHFFYFGISDLGAYGRVLEELRIRDVVFTHGQVPVKDLHSHLRDADVLLLINRHLERHEIYIPQKFFEYLAAEKPILCLTKEGSLKDAIMETNSGLIADPEDVRDISERIKECFERFFLNRETMAIRNKAKYSSLEKSRQLCRVMDSLV